MTEFSAHLDDEAVSAVLDGAATEDEARHVEACATCGARLAALRSVAAAVATAVPPVERARLDAAVAAALSAQNVVPISVARSRRLPAWLGAAAALVAVVAIGGTLGSGRDDATDQPAAFSADDAGGSATGLAEAGSGGDEMTTMDQDVAAGSTGAPGLGELRGADLRSVVEGAAAQREAVVATTAAAEEAGSPPAAGGGGGGSGAAPCEAELRATDPALGGVVFSGDGTWDGESVAVVVFELGAERRAFVAAYDGCAIRAQASWTT